MLDLIIRNARVIDGTGAPWFVSDVGVKDGIIAAIAANMQAKAREEVDGTGLILAPGFIDIHSHSDFSLPIEGCAESRILQGVTTEIGGNCGLSPAPVEPGSLEMLKKYSGFLTQGLSWKWHSFRDFLDAVREAKPATNFACLVGHGTLRVAAMGFADRKPTDEEMAHMKSLLRKSMEDGALGVSSGLIYPPGCYSTTEEIAELASVIAPYGGYYETHMRNEGDNICGSIDDSAEVGRLAGVPVQIAHHKVVGRYNWGGGKASQARIHYHRERGVDIVCDQYPYIAASTTITTIFPNWAHEGGVDGLLARLANPELRARIRGEVLESMEKTGRRFEDIMIAGVGSEENRRFEGLNVAQAAEQVGKAPCDFAIDIVLEEKASVAVVTFGMCEEDVRTIMADPLTMIGSDGAAVPLKGPGKPHPRMFGAFIRVLKKYSMDEKLISLEEAVRKITSLPAARAGLRNRGLIKEGMAADLVLLDTTALEDKPTYADPRQAPGGVKAVWVNGVLTARDGVMTGARAGQVIRHR